MLREIARHYGGYCFDSLEEKGEAVRVHCPWPVLKFFEHPQKGFPHCRAESAEGSPLLRECLKGHGLKNPAGLGQQQTLSAEQLKAPSGRDGGNTLALLVRAGCLTVQGRTGNSLLLGCPNLEEASSMAALCAAAPSGDRAKGPCGRESEGG